MRSADEARRVVDQVLAASAADEVEVGLEGGATAHLRFARNSVQTSGLYDNDALSVRCSFGRRSGSARTNQLDPASLVETVRRAEGLARLAPEDPERMPGLGGQRYLEVDAWSEETAARGPERLAEGVGRAVEVAAARGLVAAGFARVDAGYRCLANSRGLFGHQRATAAHFSLTVRTPDGAGSGWAAQSDHRLEAIDFAGRAAVATDKAARSVGPRPLAPGSYPTILEATCVASLLSILVGDLSARSADEGRSAFSAPGGNRLGQKLFADAVTIRSDPTDPAAPVAPWGEGGLPQEKRAWIENGVLANLVYERYWADKQGVPAVPAPGNVLMAGGTGSLADLVAATERGVLVTSLWYIRTVDPRTLLHTGLTRDGVFWIENGAIAYPLTNFRWNDSPLRVLERVEALSAPVRVPPRGDTGNNYVVPALRTAGFALTSVSDAV